MNSFLLTGQKWESAGFTIYGQVWCLGFYAESTFYIYRMDGFQSGSRFSVVPNVAPIVSDGLYLGIEYLIISNTLIQLDWEQNNYSFQFEFRWKSRLWNGLWQRWDNLKPFGAAWDDDCWKKMFVSVAERFDFTNATIPPNIVETIDIEHITRCNK